MCRNCKLVPGEIKEARSILANGDVVQRLTCRKCCRTRRRSYYARNVEKCRTILKKSTTKLQYKQDARMKVAVAVRAGVLHRPTECPLCGNSSRRIEGHHKDYSKPLDIEWMCSACHADADRAQRVTLNL